MPFQIPFQKPLRATMIGSTPRFSCSVGSLTWSLALALLGAGLFLTGCMGGALGPDDSSDEGGEGVTTFAIAPAADSAVPDSATHAFIRAWSEDVGYNETTLVSLADRTGETEVELALPTGSGYHVAVLAADSNDFRPTDGQYVPVAGGVSAPFSIQDGEQKQLGIDVSPFDVEINHPVNLSAGEEETVSAKLTGGYAEAFSSARVGYTDNPDYGYVELGGEQVASSEESVSYEFTFEVPDTAEPDTLHFQYVFMLEGRATLWASGEASPFHVYGPSATELKPIPIDPASGDVIISFSDD